MLAQIQKPSEQIENAVDWPWLGGFIDGEGYFGIIIKKNPNARLNFEIFPTITISSANIDILEKIKNKIHLGKIIISTKPHGNHRTVYYWYLRYKQALDFAKAIMPFLILKKDVCKHFIEIAEKIRTRNKSSVEEFLELTRMRDNLNSRPRPNTYRNYDWFRDYFQKQKLLLDHPFRNELGQFKEGHPDLTRRLNK